MIKNAIVEKTYENNMDIIIERESACGNCNNCGIIKQSNNVKYTIENKYNSKVGDNIKVKLTKNKNANIALIVYLIPVALWWIIFYISSLFFKTIIQVIITFITLIICFIMLKLIDKAMKNFISVKIEQIKENE